MYLASLACQILIEFVIALIPKKAQYIYITLNRLYQEYSSYILMICHFEFRKSFPQILSTTLPLLLFLSWEINGNLFS